MALAARTGILLASAVRNADAAVVFDVPERCHGILFILDVTVSPTTETVQIKVEAQDPGSDKWILYAQSGTLFTGTATGTKGLMLHPEAVTAEIDAGIIVKRGPVPLRLRVTADVSASGNWTFSLGWQLLD